MATYSWEISRPYLVLYWCEGCKRYLIQPISSKVTASYQSKKGENEFRNTMADYRAANKQEKIRDKLLSSDTSVLRYASFTHKCICCSHVPSWASIQGIPFIEAIAGLALLGVVGVFVLRRDFDVDIKWLYGCAIASAAGFGIDFLARCIQELGVRKGQKKHVLLFDDNIHRLRERYQRCAQVRKDLPIWQDIPQYLQSCDELTMKIFMTGEEE